MLEGSQGRRLSACRRVNKVREGRPHIVDAIKNGQVQLIINTTEGRKAISDSAQIRQSALQTKVTYTTTLAGGEAFCRAIKFGPERTVRRLQDSSRRKVRLWLTEYR